MQDDAETQPPRTQWRPWHFLLLVLPGVVFLLSFPLIYRSSVRGLKLRLEEPEVKQAEARHRWRLRHVGCGLGAGMASGALAIITLYGVTFVLTRKGGPLQGGGVLNALCMGIVNTAIAAPGCSLGEHYARDIGPPPLARGIKGEVWRASADNGDKPGIGVELRRHEGRMVCEMYLLDPSHPNNFDQGRKRPVTMTKTTADALEFTVRWSVEQSDKLRLQLPDGITGTEFRGELSELESGKATESFRFRLVE